MKFIKKSCRICLLSFRQWIGDYRIFIVFFAIFTYCFMMINPVKTFLASTGVKINACVPLFLFEQNFNKLILMLLAILLFCDAPFINKAQQMVIIRSGRNSWCIGKVFYIAGAGIIYILSIYLFSWILLFPHLEFSDQWGKAIMTLTKTDAIMQFNLSDMFVQGKIIDYFTPMQAVFFSVLLEFITVMIIGLIIFLGNFINQSVKLGILIALAFVILDFIVFSSSVFSDSRITYFSPVSWSSLNIINIGGLGRTPDIFRVAVMDIVLIAGLVTGLVFCSRRNQIE